jgi:hypothetical protein
LLGIFRHVPHAEILRGGAGLVCASWRRLAVTKPPLWRHIDLSADEDKIVSPEDVPAPGAGPHVFMGIKLNTHYFCKNILYI